MKRISMIAVLLTGLIFTGILVIAAQDGAEHSKAGDSTGLPNKIWKRGLEIAPVPLNLAGRDRKLVGEGSYIVNAQAGCNGCHTANLGTYLPGGNPFLGQPEQIDPDQYLVGGDPFGPFISRNLRPDATGNPADRYRFRTSPLRNIGLQPTFFHNGAFTSLEGVVRHYMNIFESARSFENDRGHLDADLAVRLGPIEPVLERVDFLLAQPIELTEEEVRQLVEFVRNGLLDERAKPENLRRLIPETVPSGRPVPVFE
ncbi:MAG: hypothetical protein L0229_02975 [Blastocatellia bacterium]|nr:hypothetical protein [Blastocatellia bacterium]